MSLHELAEAIEKIGDLADRIDRTGERMTEGIALLRGLSVNDVLWTGSGYLDGNGLWRKEFTVIVGSVCLVNTSAYALQIIADTPGVAPGSGVGVHNIPSGAMGKWNLAGRAVQIIGTPGATFELEVSTKAFDPGGNADSDSTLGPFLLTFANPAAGADFSLNPSPTLPWRIRSLVATLTTSVTVDNRQVTIALASGGTAFFKKAAFSVQAASLAYTYVISTADGGQDAAAEIASLPQLTVPRDVWLPAGTTLASATTLLQVGDQWSGLALLYETQP